MTDTFNHKHASTALCIWEEMVSRREQGSDSEPWALPMLDLWENIGAAEMRDVALRLAPEIDAAWNALTEAQQEALAPFDWEFVPLAVSLVNWEVAAAMKSQYLAKLPASAVSDFIAKARELGAACPGIVKQRLVVVTAFEWSAVKHQGDECATCPHEQASFWSVYYRDVEGLAFCVHDFKTPAKAEKWAQRLASALGVTNNGDVSPKS